MPTTRSARDDQTPISFPAWKEALGHATLAPGERERYRRAIVTFLKHCKDEHAPATVALIRQHLAASRDPAAREALRWFYRTANRASAAQLGAVARDERRGSSFAEVYPPTAAPEATRASADKSASPPYRSRTEVPPSAARDLGGADWERDLIAAVRERGFLWRTEETYRTWGQRFAQFIRPRSPYAATADDVANFLSMLATQQRAMPSTQKQALNALVFLVQEALHRQLGEIRFRRAAPRQRMPVVLSREECRRLFAELDGTTRLMAELMYGSGLRLMELLRLRVQHVDFAGGKIRVSGGKGDRVNGFANAAG